VAVFTPVRLYDGALVTRFAIVLIPLFAILAGCGEVVVFGHVVREAPSKSETPAPAPATVGKSTDATPQTSAFAPAASSAEAHPVPAGAHLVQAVNLILSPEAQASNSNITADALLDAIRAELRSRKLLDEHNARGAGTAEILIDDASTRPTVNAVVFGYQMMAGTIVGDVRVSGASGEELPSSRIVAESRLTVAADGSDKNPLGPLYRRFARLTADKLAGVTSQPDEPAADGASRN
jgi:hypothetical protein